MTDRRSEIKQREQAATKGPWFYGTDSCECGGGYGCNHPDWAYEIWRSENDPDPTWSDAEKGFNRLSSGRYRHYIAEDMVAKIEDGEFIAHAREDIPYLLTELEQVEAERDRYKQAAVMLKETVEKSLQPQYVTCDGSWCTGCWKDLARVTLKETAWMEEAK